MHDFHPTHKFTRKIEKSVCHSWIFRYQFPVIHTQKNSNFFLKANGLTHAVRYVLKILFEISDKLMRF